MGEILDQANRVYEDGPGTSPVNPPKHEIRRLFTMIDAALASIVTAIEAGDAVAYATRAALYADLLHDAGSLGFVFNDPLGTNNGIYLKSGASGAGAWAITALALPSTFAADLAGKQELSDNLTDLAAIVFEPDTILHIDGSGALAMAPITEAGYALLTAADSRAFTEALRTKLTSLMDTTQIQARLDAKVDTNTFLTGLAQKASTSFVTRELDKKADKADIANVSRDAGDFLQDRFGIRPGIAPHLFTSSLVGGDPHDLQPLDLPVVAATEGMVACLDGAGIVAMRTIFPVESGRKYHARATVRFYADSPDPDHDGVRFAIAWYNSAGDPLTGTDAFSVVGSDILGLLATDGAVERRAVVAKADGATIEVVAPYGAVGARPYVQRYGTGGRLLVSAVAWEDITHSKLWSPDVADLQAEIDAITSLDLGDRLTTLEAEAATPTQAGYVSQAAFLAASPPASADTIQRLGWANPGDGGHTFLKRSTASPAHGGKWQAANGSWWELAGPKFDLRQFGPCAVDTPPIDTALTMRAAQSFMVETGNARVDLPPWAITVEPPEDTRVNPGEGAILIIDHANNAPIAFVGVAGRSAIKPSTNKIELFAAVGDGDVLLEGIHFDNSENGVLQYQVKTEVKVPNGGIAGNGNQANCVIRQYEGTGRVTIRNCTATDWYCLHQHFGSVSDENVLRGEIVHERNRTYGCVFGAQYQRPEFVKIDDCESYDNIDGLNGNNSDGTETDPTLVQKDPGHYQYKSDRHGVSPRIQQVSGFRAQRSMSSPLKVRGANLASHNDFTIEESCRGAELLHCQNSMMSAGRVSLSQEYIGTDSQACAFHLRNSSASQINGCIGDIRDTNAFGVRVGDTDEEKVQIVSISKAAQGVVTTLAELPSRFVVGAEVGFYSMVGMFELDEVVATIVARTATTFTINHNTSAYSDFVSGFASSTPWANKGNKVLAVNIYQNFSVVGAKAPFMAEDQRHIEVIFPTLYQEGTNQGRNMVEFQRVRGGLVFMPRKFCSPNAPMADRLVVLEDCYDCTVIYDESAIPVPITPDTVRDNNPAGNNRIFRISGDNRIVRASAGTPEENAFGYFNNPGLGRHRYAQDVEGWASNGIRRLRYYGDRLEPEYDGSDPTYGYNLGSSTKAFDRMHLRALMLDLTMEESPGVAGRGMFGWDAPNNRLLFKTVGQNYEVNLIPVV